MLLVAGRCRFQQVLAAAQDVGVAAALGIVEDIVGLQTVDDEETVEVRAKNIFGHVVAAAAANGVNGDVLRTEDPQPGIDVADAPTGFVGMNDVGAAQGVEHKVIGGPGEVGQALFGADEGSRARVQTAVGC